jgi:uncharacterized membrane protein YoaK (UPF0700 family)
MKNILTPEDVHEAIDAAFCKDGSRFNSGIAAELNRRIEQRSNHRWRRYGLILEGFGMGGVAIGVLMLWSPEYQLHGILSATLGFVVGIVGHGMGEPR